jgi:hypothetical protein
MNVFKIIGNYYLKLEKILSNMKFAVVIIFLFSIALIFGTFMESYHGREFANRLVYKSFWFMGIQLLMFLSILTATLVRLPAKKRLYGFYTIHAGLILLFIGSFITYINGIDGIVELRPSEPTNKIQLDEDILAIRTTSGKVIRVPLPKSAFAVDMDKNVEGFELKEYLPSSDLTVQWNKLTENNNYEHSSKYFLYNENVSQEFILTLASLSDFKSSTKLGPLSISYMPKALFECFKTNTDTPFILWNVFKNTCASVSSDKFITGTTKTNKKFMVHQWNGEKLKFFPNISPLPLNDDLSKRTNTPFRVFSKEIFERSPHLFLFGESLSFYKKISKKWVGREFDKINSEVKLPWMNFKIKLIDHRTSEYPTEVPTYSKPIQDNGEIIKGNLKAAKINIFGIDHWVRNDKPLTLSDGERNMQLMIIKSEKRLPYQLTLEKFKMDTNPGTKDPASYESFVSLLDGRSKVPGKTHHIFMNNPLKYDEFTFYQSSYFPLGPDTYGSALSVNYDPGRALKYLGSLLIVIGSMWHFYIRRKKLKEPQKNNANLVGEANA